MIDSNNKLTSFVVQASPKNTVGYFSTMFNTSMIQDWLIVSLPKRMIDVTVRCISEVGTNVKEHNIIEHCSILKGRHWIDIPSEHLNLTAGYHLYKIVFYDNIINVDCTMYFAYNIQDDNPEKPYDYMDAIRKAQEEAEEDSGDDTDDTDDGEGEG